MGSTVQVEFGKRVRALRIAAEFSQEEFAALANIDRATFGKLERGELNVSLLTMSRVAVALDMSLAVLLEGVALDAAEIKGLPRSARGPSPIGRRRGSAPTKR
jgi:transcriptional regulator with XRE-family HTH domain